MKLIRRYKRARYSFWRAYPGLFSLYRKLLFPLQLAGICLAVYAVANFNQDDHITYPSTYTSTETLPVNIQTALPDIRSNIDAVSSLPVSEQQHEINSGFTLTLPTVTGLEDAGNSINQLSSIQQRQRTAPQPLELQSVDQTLTTDYVSLHSQTVANTQRSNLYVIQIASSTDYEALLDYGRGLSQLGAITIYPSGESEHGRVHYGISTGLFGSNAEALKALESLPDSVRNYDPWVRAVDNIKVGHYVERYE